MQPEEEAQILRCNQIVHARHGVAKSQSTIIAEKSDAIFKRWALPGLPCVHHSPSGGPEA